MIAQFALSSMFLLAVLGRWHCEQILSEADYALWSVKLEVLCAESTQMFVI
jgi:hypothetical protein